MKNLILLSLGAFLITGNLAQAQSSPRMICTATIEVGRSEPQSVLLTEFDDPVLGPYRKAIIGKYAFEVRNTYPVRDASNPEVYFEVRRVGSRILATSDGAFDSHTSDKKYPALSAGLTVLDNETDISLRCYLPDTYEPGETIFRPWLLIGP